MRVLLDSHTLIWAADDIPKLSAKALSLVQDPLNDRLISAATIWEITIKVSKNRLPLSMLYRPWMNQVMADLCLTLWPITLDHAERHIVLPPHHADPFDRLLIAQSLVEDIPLISCDTIFDAYGVTRIWD